MPFSRFLVVLTLGGLAVAQSAPPTGSPSPQTTAPGSAQSAPAPAAEPTHSQKPANPEAERERSGTDPLLDLPPLPNHSATLVGGVVARAAGAPLLPRRTRAVKVT